VPYQNSGNSYDIDKTYKLSTEQFQWGGVNQEGVYLEEAVSVNNSKNMRGNFSLFANKLIEQGQKQKAINVLNKAVEQFPNSKLQFDRYDIALAECYLKAGDIKNGKAVLKEIISYYVSYVKYLEQFKGKKAQSVEGEKMLSIYILAELGALSQQYNLKQEVELAQSIPMVSEIMETYTARDLLQSYAMRLNQINSILATDRAKAEAELLKIIDELNTNILATNNQTLIDQTAQYFGFIYSTAYRNSLTQVQKALSDNPKITSIISSLASAQ
jgi:tetratricopeptide (TPR) repeat protein